LDNVDDILEWAMQNGTVAEALETLRELRDAAPTARDQALLRIAEARAQ
jgi:hypothetical protein